MRIITQRRDIDQLLKQGVLDLTLAESLTREWVQCSSRPDSASGLRAA